MKICLINNLYPPNAVGGAETVVEKTAKSLVAKGEEAVVITSGVWKGWGSWKPERVEESGVVVYRFWVPNIFPYRSLRKHNLLSKLAWHKIDIFNCWSASIVRGILAVEKPDEVQTHNLMGIGFGVPRAIQRMRVKHIHVLHDVQLVEPSGVLSWNHVKDSLAQRMYGWLMKKRMGKPDEVLVLSEFLQDFYKKREFFLNSEWKVERVAVEMSGIEKEGKTKFLFVGSLVGHKGVHILIQAWERLGSVDAELHIVGDGFLKEAVEKWSERDVRVFVYGRQEGKELERVYNECSVLVFPSVCMENRPAVILEGLSHGLKVLAANTGGVRELVDEKTGWLVQPGNVDELYKKMGELV